MCNDNKLMQRVQAGDKFAFDEIVIKYRLPAISFACSYVHNRSDAEDIAQECFVKIYINRMSYQPSYAFKTYLFTLIRNSCIDVIRKNEVRKLENLDSIFEVSNDENPDKIIIRQEQMNMISEILNGLQNDYKTALYLYAYEEMSYEDIGKVMRKTTGQVKITIYRARKKLKKLYEGGGKVEN